MMTVDETLVESYHVLHLNCHRNYYLHPICEFSMPSEWSTGKADDTEIQLIACKRCAKNHVFSFGPSKNEPLQAGTGLLQSVLEHACQHEQTRSRWWYMQQHTQIAQGTIPRARARVWLVRKYGIMVAGADLWKASLRDGWLGQWWRNCQMYYYLLHCFDPVEWST